VFRIFVTSTERSRKDWRLSINLFTFRIHNMVYKENEFWVKSLNATYYCCSGIAWKRTVTEVSEEHTAFTTSPNEGTCHESLISVTFKKVVPPHAMEALGGGKKV
jgi:hypothetical protein